LVFDILSQK